MLIIDKFDHDRKSTQQLHTTVDACDQLGLVSTNISAVYLHTTLKRSPNFNTLTARQTRRHDGASTRSQDKNADVRCEIGGGKGKAATCALTHSVLLLGSCHQRLQPRSDKYAKSGSTPFTIHCSTLRHRLNIFGRPAVRGIGAVMVCIALDRDRHTPKDRSIKRDQQHRIGTSISG